MTWSWTVFLVGVLVGAAGPFVVFASWCWWSELAANRRADLLQRRVPLEPPPRRGELVLVEFPRERKG